ncbi:MAG: hypothetical protein JRF65_04730 [Deltaproteobacteria bacterium]|nr:hypothetical protein [Deltaproteobacteria bacterium]
MKKAMIFVCFTWGFFGAGQVGAVQAVDEMVPDIQTTEITGRAAQWTSVGGQVSPASHHSEQPTMLMVGNTPAVGYRSDSYKTYLNVWNGSGWGTPEPDPSNNMTHGATSSSPAFCSDGSDIFLTFSKIGDSGSSGADFYDRIFVYKWNSSTHWTVQNGGNEISIPWNHTLGGSDAFDPNIACRPSGNPLVTWIEQEVSGSTDADTYVAEVTAITSTASSSLSRNNTSGPYSTHVEVTGITVNDSGTAAYVAQWEHHPSEMWQSDLYVTQFSGGGFTNLGGAIAVDHDSNNLTAPSLALIGGNIYVAYTAANNTDYTKHVYVKRWDGSAWSTVGGGPVSAFSSADHYDSSSPNLLAVGNDLFLAWDESDTYGPYAVFVAYWDGTAGSWQMASEAITVPSAGDSIDPSLAYLASEDTIYIAFSANTDGWHHIFVKKIKRLAAEITATWPVGIPRCGGVSALWANVKNIGALPMPATADVWFQADGSGWTGDHWIGSANVSGLMPGAAKWYAAEWHVSSGLPAGLFAFQAQVWTDTALSELSPLEWFFVFDFGPYGVYAYGGSTWELITPTDPEGMTAISNSLIFDFGIYGVYDYDGSDWTLLTGTDPEQMLAWNFQMAFDFGPYGVYSFDGTTWTFVTGTNSENMITWGAPMVIDFGIYGVYAYDGTSWTLITAGNPDGMVAWGPYVVMDFGASGIYSYDGTTWSAITSTNPETMTTWGKYLVADFGALGVYRYDGTAWTLVTAVNPEKMIGWGALLVMDFGALGVYAYDGTGWALITGTDPEDMVSAIFN